jgi:Pyruvate/2-oxoacid:ferredoxin oxidoreductase gamma subunit
MVGLITGATGIVGIDEACEAIRDWFPGAAGEQNEALARAASRVGSRTGAAA